MGECDAGLFEEFPLRQDARPPAPAESGLIAVGPLPVVRAKSRAPVLGGKGGAAGEGGGVNVTNAGSVTTSGDWAQGVFAQSVGGGGGKGGTSVSNTAGAIAALNFAIGGSGGAGG